MVKCQVRNLTLPERLLLAGTFVGVSVGVLLERGGLSECMFLLRCLVWYLSPVSSLAPEVMQVGILIFRPTLEIGPGNEARNSRHSMA